MATIRERGDKYQVQVRRIGQAQATKRVLNPLATT